MYCDFKIITYLLNRGSVKFDCIENFKLSYLHNPKLSDDEKKMIYAKAYNQTPEAAQLSEFLKTMETYKTLITADTIKPTDRPAWRI